MKYQAKANGIFGRLRPKYKEAEAEEDDARKENAILKSALAKARSQHGDALFINEGLRKELAQVKKQLETTKAVHRTTVDMNVDLVQKNEVLKKKNEDLAQSNLSLAKQVNDVQAKEERHLTKRRKLEEELRALKDLGPPLTEDLRKEIHAEYRKSAELNDEIVHMYSEGYEICRSKGKAKLVAAKVDPSLLDSSNSEDDDEA